jgi:glutathione S-transferase
LGERRADRGAQPASARSNLVARGILRVAALAGGIADKAVTLLYSSLDLMKPSALWSERCQTQIAESFAFLEAELGKRTSTYWFGEALTHADIAVACSYRFTREAHPNLFALAQIPTIAALAERCEALPEFRDVYLPITNNLKKT